MKIERFEDILAWQKARVITKTIYITFGDLKDYAFRNQICNAAVSVMNNIAEGFERKSNKEFKQFLFSSKGSCGEVRSMLNVALDCDYIDTNLFNKLLDSVLEVSKMLSGLIKTLD